MRLTQTSDLWWKNAVVYCLDVETYADGNGDGCGDFRGLIQQIDHLDRLGVTCIWLMPFYPSPDRDDGYDITDFYGVDPRLGTLGDFVEFVRTARDRGMRVIADLVVNHTSDQHPWFVEARSSRDSPKRDWYIWVDEEPADAAQGVVFPDQETSVWELDKQTGQYYLHQFYKHQPDLNVANPQVRDEIARIMGFWMQLGLSGFRVDAVNFLIETKRQQDKLDLPDPHDYLADLAAFLRRRSGEAVLLGEVNLPYPGPDAVLRGPRRRRQHGRADHVLRLHRHAGDVPVARPRRRGAAGRRAQAAARAARGRALGHLRAQPRRADPGQAHRRPAPGGLRPRSGRTRTCSSTGGGSAGGCRRCSTATSAGSGWSTACSSPCRARPCCSTARRSAWATTSRSRGGSPSACRCSGPAEPGAGFSTADPSTFPEPLAEGKYGPKQVNVRDQSRDPDSLLTFFRHLVDSYRACPELAWGTAQVIDPGPDAAAVLAHRADADDVAIVAVHNMADRKVTATLPLSGLAKTTLFDVLAADGSTEEVGDDGTLKVTLPPYGYRWLRSAP